MPWIKVPVTAPELDVDSNQIDSASPRAMFGIQNSPTELNSLKSQLLFGPSDHEAFRQVWDASDATLKSTLAEVCMNCRQDLDFSWTSAATEPVRKWVLSIVEEKHLYLVNYQNLLPGGYVVPHIDRSQEPPDLIRLYAAITWPKDARFGFTNFGDLPISAGDVFIINAYQKEHWVSNESDLPRIILNIAVHKDAVNDLIVAGFKRMVDWK